MGCRSALAMFIFPSSRPRLSHAQHCSHPMIMASSLRPTDRAKKHVDGNNIGPSYICALGEHEGGGLWTADQYIQSTDPKDGSLVVKGGGGEAVLDCRNSWKLFNGNAEHETQAVKPVTGKEDYVSGLTNAASVTSAPLMPRYSLAPLRSARRELALLFSPTAATTSCLRTSWRR